MAKEGLGSDDLSGANGYRMLVIIAVTTFFLWLLINVQAESIRGLVYVLMGLSAIIFIGLDRAFKKFPQIDSILEENSNLRLSFLRGLSRQQILIGGILVSAFFAFNISRTGLAAVNAPLFQVAEFATNKFMQAFISGILGIIENAFFFSFIFPTIAANLNIKGLPQVATIPVAILASGLVFVLFHFLVYGSANAVASQTVFMFGVINSTIVYAFRSLIISDLIHFTNNFSIVFFSKVAVGVSVLFV